MLSCWSTAHLDDPKWKQAKEGFLYGTIPLGHIPSSTSNLGRLTSGFGDNIGRITQPQTCDPYKVVPPSYKLVYNPH